MTEEEKLAKAYLIFGLEGGSSSEEVAERYKDLVMAWHSDRYPSGEKKLKAEEEMKKINNARDLLKKHFAENHKKTGPCACRPGSKASQTPPPPPPPPPDTKAEEEAARKRNAQRAAAAEAARKAKEAEAAAARAQKEAENAAEAQRQASVKNAIDLQKQSDDEALRWRVFLGIVAAWVILSLFSVVSLGVEHVWHNISMSIEQFFAKKDEPVPPAPTSNTTTTPVAPTTGQAPSNDSAMPPPELPQDNISEQAKRDQDEANRKTAEILRLKTDIDQAQKTIDHCNQEIGEMEVQIANPAVGSSERYKLIGYQNQQKSYLSQAQMNLNTAQKMLADITGQPAPTPIPIEPHVTPTPVVVDQQELRRRADAFINPNPIKPFAPLTPAPTTKPTTRSWLQDINTNTTR